MTHPSLRLGLSAIAALVVCLLLPPAPRAAWDTLPAALSDAEFWALSDAISEPNGYFQSDDLTSNEMTVSVMAEQLAERVKTGGVYVGVGPEQNYTYIAAIRPKIAFINDIRRGNLQIHLMYKALFELASDRADFVSLLFTKPRPAGLTASSTAAALMNAYWDIPTVTDGTYEKTLQAIDDVLLRKHHLPLSADDLSGVADRFHAFYWCGPSINYSVPAGTAICRASNQTWADLMMSLDGSGRERSFLSSEEAFAAVKTLHARNLIVPTVGDFAGPKALRAIGRYLKEHDAPVSAFYVSNVESYLRDRWQTFCANVATMPLDEGSLFVRPSLGAAVNFITANGVTVRQFVSVIGAPAASGAPTPGKRQSLSSIADEVATNHCGEK